MVVFHDLSQLLPSVHHACKEEVEDPNKVTPAKKNKATFASGSPEDLSLFSLVHWRQMSKSSRYFSYTRNTSRVSSVQLCSRRICISLYICCCSSLRPIEKVTGKDALHALVLCCPSCSATTVLTIPGI